MAVLERVNDDTSSAVALLPNRCAVLGSKTEEIGWLRRFCFAELEDVLVFISDRRDVEVVSYVSEDAVEESCVKNVFEGFCLESW